MRTHNKSNSIRSHRPEDSTERHSRKSLQRGTVGSNLIGQFGIFFIWKRSRICCRWSRSSRVIGCSSSDIGRSCRRTARTTLCTIIRRVHTIRLWSWSILISIRRHLITTFRRKIRSLNTASGRRGHCRCRRSLRIQTHIGHLLCHWRYRRWRRDTTSGWRIRIKCCIRLRESSCRSRKCISRRSPNSIRVQSGSLLVRSPTLLFSS